MPTDPNDREAVERIAPSAVRYAIRYGDDSGDELAVSLDKHDRYYPGQVKIETANDDVYVDAGNLDWLIASLNAVRSLLTKDQSNGQG